MRTPPPRSIPGDLRASPSTFTRHLRGFRPANRRPSRYVQEAFTGTPLTPLPMPVPRLLLSVLSLGLLVVPVSAADAPSRESCLTKAEQRAAVAANQAISLAQAIKFLRE